MVPVGTATCEPVVSGSMLEYAEAPGAVIHTSMGLWLPSADG